MHQILNCHYFFLIQIIQLGLPILLIATTHYFLIIRPQQIQFQQLQELNKKISIASKVTTSQGIVGIIVAINTQTLILELWDGQKIEIFKTAVTHVETKH